MPRSIIWCGLLEHDGKAMTRAVILVLDSVGIGGAPDAAAFGDDGADTLGHIAQACLERARGPLALPNLARLGLGEAYRVGRGRGLPGLDTAGPPIGGFGAAREVSPGKDTPSGHWEIAGVPVPFEWGYFPRTVPAFPPALVAALVREAALPGILGDCHASGTEIIALLGEEHLRTGKPICYTSADSVFQIAAHEERFGLDRLHDVCATARRLVDPWRIGRVIARPFVGSDRASFRRTANRRDFAVKPPRPTILDIASDDGRDVVTIGKIADIFAHSGTGRVLKGNGNMELLDATLAGLEGLKDGGLLFANFVEFDTEYGHRRDVAGYAAALEAFDRRLPELLARRDGEDLVIVTADHGCDPTFAGTDHTREKVPVLALGPGLAGRALGERSSFADIGASVARHLGLQSPGAGVPFVQ
jgi:phosphopentomutase